jgi:hypothetical protein
MIVISSREFREHQKKYFDLVDQLKQVIVQRGKNKSYILTPIRENDRMIVNEDFQKMIKEAEEEYKKGETKTMSIDEIEKFLYEEV